MPAAEMDLSFCGFDAVHFATIRACIDSLLFRIGCLSEHCAFLTPYLAAFFASFHVRSTGLTYFTFHKTVLLYLVSLCVDRNDDIVSLTDA